MISIWFAEVVYIKGNDVLQPIVLHKLGHPHKHCGHVVSENDGYFQRVNVSHFSDLSNC
jgi:hypothetical protein